MYEMVPCPGYLYSECIHSWDLFLEWDAVWSCLYLLQVIMMSCRSGGTGGENNAFSLTAVEERWKTRCILFFKTFVMMTSGRVTESPSLWEEPPSQHAVLHVPKKTIIGVCSDLLVGPYTYSHFIAWSKGKEVVLVTWWCVSKLVWSVGFIIYINTL